MKLPTLHQTRRPGFTIIEILVVVAIIVILMGLLTAAVLKSWWKGPEAKTRNDIMQLANAVENFKTKFGFYPPSRIRLRDFLFEYQPTLDLLDADSVFYLTTMFPKMADQWNTPPTQIYPGTNLPGGIDWTQAWTQAAQPSPPSQPKLGVNIVLEGDQCLVFFLGGVPTLTGGVPGTVGFSNNPFDPWLPPVPQEDRIKFFDFNSDRLVWQLQAGAQNPNFTTPPYTSPPPPNTTPSSLPSGGSMTTPITGTPPAIPPNAMPKPTNPGQPGSPLILHASNLQSTVPFMSYLDPYGSSDGQGTIFSGVPYAYFSSYKNENGYNRYYSYRDPFTGLINVSDCVTLGVWPYAEAPLNQTQNPATAFPYMRYLNPRTYQIISAGNDGIFGSGTNPLLASVGYTWSPANAQVYGKAGADDMSNFYDLLLGVSK